MMVPGSHRSAYWWSLAAKVVGIALALAAGWILYTLSLGAVRLFTSHPHWSDLVVDGVSVLPLALASSGFLAWQAWRLWFRWNAATVRWNVAFLLAIGLLGIVGAVQEHMYRSSPPTQRPFQVGVVVALIFGAILYRRISRAVIRLARLDDPKDEYGNPLGHTGRTQSFCTLLGWSVWMAGTSFDIPLSHGRPDAWREILFGFGPIVLGWVVYKVSMLWLKPPTRPPVPLGGFGVIPMATVVPVDVSQNQPT